MKIETLTAVHDLSDFTCTESEIENWLKSDALGEQKARRSKTFLLTDDDYGTLGYFTLAATKIEGKATPRSLVGNSRKDCQGFVLAKLGVHQEYQGQRLGSYLVHSAFNRCLEAESRIGGRIVIVDLLNKSLDSFYEKSGFEVSISDTRRGVSITRLQEAR